MNIFILDDSRTLKMALVDSRRMGVSTMDRVMPEATYSMARNPEDAINVIRASPKFDVWILDNDLGIINGFKEEGYEFLKRCINEFGDKVPDVVYSCSANPERREQIETLHTNWLKNGKVPMDPV